jgi:hypothetical protein
MITATGAGAGVTPAIIGMDVDKRQTTSTIGIRTFDPLYLSFKHFLL